MAAVPAYQFASTGYLAQFPDQTSTEKRWGAAAELRNACLEYLRGFNPKSWYDMPMMTVLNGEAMTGGEIKKTVDAFGTENGSQILATDAQADAVLNHIKTYKSPRREYMAEIERIDNILMHLPSCAIIMGNQMLDYRKQDGVTEVIESQGANSVERKLNAALLADEAAGNVTIVRTAAFCGCVSNFSNFLDLSRKCMRNIELGIPVVVLSRSNTTQHMFRWYQMLLNLMKDEKIDPGMLTFFSCSIEQTKRMFAACPDNPAYFTCSRDLAKEIKKNAPKLISSTGGPNTLVATKLTAPVSTAIRLSGTIENKGQCTALRHLVLPGCTEKDVDDIFAPTPVVDTPLKSLEDGVFAGLFAGVNDRPVAPGYKALPSQPVIHMKMATEPPKQIEECWRQPIIDVTVPSSQELKSEEFLLKLSLWLIREQPISLAINGDDDLALALFERTGLVVYSVGSLEKPALTAQARPEDGECFGEFPPRSSLQQFTHLPVIIPSSTPGYNAEYTNEGLVLASGKPYPPGLEYCEGLFNQCSKIVLGYVKTLCAYLADSCGPKRGVGHGGRTPLFGLQRPPILDMCPSVLRITTDASFDAAVPYLVPFYITNARMQLQVSVDPGSPAANRLKPFVGLKVIHESESEFHKRVATFTPYNTIVVNNATVLEPMLAMHWVSRLVPMGHIKSVNSKDDAFVEKFGKSRKWLAIEKSNSSL